MKATELAWAAGFFDGEGSTLLRWENKKNNLGKRYGTVGVSMSLAQVRKEPLYRFKRALGVGCINGPYQAKGKRKPYRVWRTSGRNSVHQTLSRLWKYLSLPKRQQATMVWAKLDKFRSKKSPALRALPPIGGAYVE